MKPTRNTLDPARLPPVLRTDQVAAITGLNVVTIQRKIRSGELAANKLGKIWLVPKREVEKYL